VASPSPTLIRKLGTLGTPVTFLEFMTEVPLALVTKEVKKREASSS
jgi:hypothetical protein